MQPIIRNARRQPPLAHGVESTGRWSAATVSSVADEGRGVSPQVLAEA